MSKLREVAAMQRRLFIMMLMGLTALSTSALLAQSNPRGPKSPVTIHTRLNPFNIEFTVDRSSGKQPPVEVQLHVADSSGTWRLHDTQGPAEYTVPEPRKPSFSFSAPADGEYLFMIRSLDRSGQLWPKGPPAADMRIVVDTENPTLELTPKLLPSGEIHASWRVKDRFLRTDSFKLEYQVGGPTALWQNVLVDRLEPMDNTGYAGETRWTPRGRGPITIRAQIRDEAGNLADSVIPLTPNENPITRPDERPEARDDARRSDTRWPAERTTALPTSNHSKELTPPEMDSHFPGDVEGESLPAPRPDRPFQSTTRGDRENEPQVEELPPGGLREERVNRESPGSDRDRDPPPEEEVSGPRMSADFPMDNASLPSAADAPNNEAVPPGVRPRMVNSRKFALEYDVESVGASGVAKVELWGTTDGGETWRSFAVDEDNRSPFQVTVASEGLYGFSMVVESGNGLRGQSPRPGDQPEMWVGVDLTKPIARLMGAENSRDEQREQLTIRWEASDEQLATRPVALYFSEARQGPRTTIASGLNNTGEYQWQLDSRVPDRLFIWLEVRDEAGNLQLVESDSVTLDRVRPSGRLKSVRPVGDAARGPKRVYNLHR